MLVAVQSHMLVLTLLGWWPLYAIQFWLTEYMPSLAFWHDVLAKSDALGKYPVPCSSSEVCRSGCITLRAVLPCCFALCSTLDA